MHVLTLVHQPEAGRAWPACSVLFLGHASDISQAPTVFQALLQELAVERLAARTPPLKDLRL